MEEGTQGVSVTVPENNAIDSSSQVARLENIGSLATSSASSTSALVPAQDGSQVDAYDGPYDSFTRRKISNPLGFHSKPFQEIDVLTRNQKLRRIIWIDSLLDHKGRLVEVEKCNEEDVCFTATEGLSPQLYACRESRIEANKRWIMCFRIQRNPGGIRVNFEIDTVLLTENMAYNIIELLECIGGENDCMESLAVGISRMVTVDNQGVLVTDDTEVHSYWTELLNSLPDMIILRRLILVVNARLFCDGW